ncbi:M1-specific T cell receptor beta chain [Pungitius pungitius]|uniref:M1-specific T cell receptor beta chain n=1 Tax=Pungitius pungitius TaxID=134920 RepID=UPI002E0D2E70
MCKLVVNSLIASSTLKMIPGFNILAFFMLWTAGVSQSVLITQWPRYISSPPNGSAEMTCYQNDTSYDYLYWYQQLSRGSFQLMVVIVGGMPSYEVGFKSGFQSVKSSEKQWSLTITGLQRNHTAVYLCAASLHNNANEAYFGKGTKLTVLEPGLSVTRPKVKVLRPSAKECGNPKDKARKKTIVCVASGFYPDHVGVSWNIDGQNVTKGVATDNAALRGDQYYRISSRLSVSAEDWFKTGKTFTCTVSFFNGETTEFYYKSTTGVKDTRSGMTREKYLMVTQMAKVSYIIFIIKSSIYGAFVAFLVWRLQRSAGKHND